MDRNGVDQTPSEHSDRPAAQLLLKLGITTLCRLTLNTARRFPYPFAAAFSRGLGIPLTGVTSVIALTQAIGILGFISGPLTDRIGYRAMMMAGLALMITGMLTGALMPSYAPFCAALLLAGLGKFVFDPALQAYVGEHVPFRRRGRVVGILETSWAGSTLLGIPLIGLLIQHVNWRAPFFFLGGIGIVGAIALWFVIPGAGEKKAASPAPRGGPAAFRQLFGSRTAIGALGFGFLISAANDNLFVVYGVWLERAHGLSVAAIGAGTILIGLAELSGESFTAFLADRFGLKRSVWCGALLSAASYALFPLFQHHLLAALAGLFCIFLCFEFTIVTFLSLCTELLPGARATMMAGFLAAAGIGRMVGAFAGIPIWRAGGITVVGLASAGISLLALLLFSVTLRTWRQPAR